MMILNREGITMDLGASIAGIRAFNGDKNLVVSVIKENGVKRLSTIHRNQLGWFSCHNTSLNRVCEVATPALANIWFWDLRAHWAIEGLQKRVIHYSTKHRATPEMIAFLKAADEFLHPQPSIIPRIVKAVVAEIWPFGGPHLISNKTVLYQPKQMNATPHAPVTRSLKTGTIPLDQLYSISDLKSGILPQKFEMMDKILKGKKDSGALEWLQFQAPSSESLLDVIADVGRHPMPLNSHKHAYDYRQTANHFTCTVNFADHGLFKYWKSPVLAQDELQVLEHPDLGRLEQHLSGWSLIGQRTESLGGTPTPWLVKGVKRHGVVSGVYGSQLAKLSPNQAKGYISRLSNPTESNILAMAAISHWPFSKGNTYSSAQILQLFQAAYTAFKGAKQEAQRLGKPLAIQTGNWGAGAFGNDAELMAVIQILAARYAGVDKLDYYTYSNEGQTAYNRACKFIKELDHLRDAGATPTLGSILKIVYQTDFKIGKSNGT